MRTGHAQGAGILPVRPQRALRGASEVRDLGTPNASPASGGRRPLPQNQWVPSLLPTSRRPPALSPWQRRSIPGRCPKGLLRWRSARQRVRAREKWPACWVRAAGGAGGHYRAGMAGCPGAVLDIWQIGPSRVACCPPDWHQQRRLNMAVWGKADGPLPLARSAMFSRFPIWYATGLGDCLAQYGAVGSPKSRWSLLGANGTNSCTGA